MPTKIIKRKNKAPFKYTYYDVHITNISFFLFNVDNNSFNFKKFNICQIRNKTTVIDKANNWNVSPYKEAYMIRKYRPSLNFGLKTSREMQLF